MATNYLHKQTVIIFVVCAFAVGYTIFYTRNHKQPEAIANLADISTVSSTSVSQSPAIENTDWKSQFFDATSTKSFRSSTASSSSQNKSKEKLTATDIFARNFFSKYMEMRKEGVNENGSFINAAVNELIDSNFSSLATPKTFSQADISVVSATDHATLLKYGQTIKDTLNRYIPDAEHNEATLAKNALEKDDMASLSQLDQVIANYQNALKIFSSINVPAPVAKYHISLMDGINMAQYIAKTFRNIESDPVSAMAGLGLEMTALETMNNAVISITQYLLDNGIDLTI